MAEKECIPLKTLDELRDWRNILKIHKNVLEFQNIVENSANKSKRLLCHDMAGGYLNDRFVNGCSAEDSYRFYHWSQIDIFVYFSHNLITVPPICWINAGHLHGVPVLGTFITEWFVGAKVCENFLQDIKTYEEVANILVDIAVALKFDGWLLNIENPIQSTQIGNLVDFVRVLSKKMHDEVGHSKVIWYDSVTTEGKLKWQNELNELNRCFFDNCDGIFINYTWKEENLVKCVEQAGLRLHDVYIGIDVFGRNCFGGGGYSTDLAMIEIEKKDLSSAIFAPGWVHEVCGGENFTQNENKFWSLIAPYCQYNPIIKLPIESSLCQGFGNKRFSKGKIADPNPWFNLSCQEMQPTIGCGQDDFVSICINDAYNGGSCRQYQGTNSAVNQLKYYSLFKLNIPCKKVLSVMYATKDLMKNGTVVNIALHMAKKCGGEITKVHTTSSNLISSEDENNWWHARQSTLVIEKFNDLKLIEIGLEIIAVEREFKILLGYIKICECT